MLNFHKPIKPCDTNKMSTVKTIQCYLIGQFCHLSLKNLRDCNRHHISSLVSDMFDTNNFFWVDKI